MFHFLFVLILKNKNQKFKNQAQKNQTFKLNRFLSDLFLQGKSFHYGKKQLYLDANISTIRKKDDVGIEFKKDSVTLRKFNTIHSKNMVPYNFRTVEFTSKANVLDNESMFFLNESIKKSIFPKTDFFRFFGKNQFYTPKWPNMSSQILTFF